jgi:exo-beta-1,3-glucanase (GH17 family)
LSARVLVAAALLAWAGAASVAGAAANCGRHPAAAPALARLQSSLRDARFIAYQPTQIRIVAGKSSRADDAGIHADLTALRSRFDALITYGTLNGADRVPDIAARLGYRAVILGVWDAGNAAEIKLALAAAARHPQLVQGLSLGNERVLAGTTSFAQLAQALAALRRTAPQLPLTTTEPFHLLTQPAALPLLQDADFLLVNAHPVFQPWFRTAGDADAARFVVNVLHEVEQQYCGPVLVKETGVPTAPAALGYTVQRQASFYAELRVQLPGTTQHAFAYFSAFDAAWRVLDSHPTAGPQPQEGSWGLFDETRAPKPAALQLPLLPGRAR